MELQGVVVVLAVALVGVLLDARENVQRSAGVYELLQYDVIVLATALLALTLGFLSSRRWNEIHREIMVRKSTEEALRESEERLRLALDTARMGTWVADLQTGQTRWSEGNERLYGLPVGGFHGGTDQFLALVHPDDRPAVEEAIAALTYRTDPVVVEFRVVWPNGTIRCLESRGQVFRDESSQAVRVIGTNVDITDRKRAQEELDEKNAVLERKNHELLAQQHELENEIGERRRAEEALKATEVRLRTVISNLPVVVFGLDQEGVFTFSDGKGLDLVGLRPGEAVGMSVFDVYREHPELLDQIRRALQDGTVSWTGEVGGYFFETQGTPLKDDRGEVVGLIGVAVNATERLRSQEALRKSESQLRLALEAAKMGIWDVDLESGKNTWSESHERLFGLEPGTFEGTFDAILSRIHPEDRPLFRELERNVEVCGAMPLEYRALWPDGSVRYIESRAQLLRSESGRPVRLIGASVDVTDRKLAEEQQRQSQIQFAQAQQLAHLGSWEWHLLDDKVIWSDELYRIQGVRPGEFELSYEAILDCVHPNDREYFHQVIDEAYRMRQPYELYYRVVRPDGEIRTLHARGIVVTDEAGQPVRMFGSALDVTAQKRIEAALRESRARFLKMASNVPGMMYQFVLHTDGVIDFPFVSEGCVEIYGLQPHEIQANPSLTFEVVHPEDRPSLDESIALSARTLQPWKWEGRLVLPSGEQKWVEAASRPERQENGNILWDGLLVDVTERKQLHAQVIQSDKLAALGQMVAGVAHEINNPLATISGSAQLLEMHPDEKVKRRAETVRRMSERATQIVRSMLSFARDSGGDRRSTSINEMVESALEMCAYRLRRADVHLELRLADPSPVATICDGQLQQVVVNLVTNAEHALRTRADSGGRITVSTDTHQEADGTLFATITVEDNGCGIPPAVQKRIFDPFFTTKDVGEGTGLGLSICHGIVRSHGGRLTLDSRVGEGTAFVLSLPLTETAELAA